MRRTRASIADLPIEKSVKILAQDDHLSYSHERNAENINGQFEVTKIQKVNCCLSPWQS